MDAGVLLPSMTSVGVVQTKEDGFQGQGALSICLTLLSTFKQPLEAHSQHGMTQADAAALPCICWQWRAHHEHACHSTKEGRACTPC